MSEPVDLPEHGESGLVFVLIFEDLRYYCRVHSEGYPDLLPLTATLTITVTVTVTRQWSRKSLRIGDVDLEETLE